MSDQPSPPPGDPPPDKPGNQPIVQGYSHQPVTARVPDRVARGVLSTGQIILDSPREFVIDFFQHLTRPHQVAARVVVPPSTMAEFAAALRQNLDTYTRTFGAPPPLPPPGPNRPTLQEIYENFKLPEDMMSGVYANAVLIGHTPAEFFLDFITTFYPTSAVSARVYLSAMGVPRFLSSVETALQQFQKRYQQNQQNPPPPPQQPPPPAGES